MISQAKNLLIIEDNPDNRNENEYEYLNANEYNIMYSDSLADARAKLTSVSYHAVVSDYFLKDGLCTDLIPWLKGIPLIVMITETNEDEVLVALKCGAWDYVIKDGRKTYRKLLPLTIQKALEQKKQAEELQKYRNELENIVEERTLELIDMYSKLQESETNFRNIFDSTNDGIIILDYNLNYIEANMAVLNQFGITKDFLSSHVLMNFIVPDYRDLVLERIELIKKGLPSGSMELEFIAPYTGAILAYEVSSVPIVFNQKTAILSIMRDIAERKNHARKLFETIIQTEEEERSRIARDLHDEIGPLISALKIYTTSFIESKTQEKKDKLAAQMGSIVREVIESIKIISNDMSPHTLVNFGLLAAIQNFIGLFSNIEIRVVSNLDNLRFPPTVESLIYRIFKELINNTIKHARASEIIINIDYADTAIVCNYRDNGIGFDWKQQIASPAKGMGINNIIARIRSLSGDFEVNVEPNKGFELNFVLQTSHKNASKEKV